MPNLKRSSFQKLLKDLQLEYVKNRNSALLEREDLMTWRRSYLDKIWHCRARNSPMYYLDGTWVDAGEIHSRTWVDTTVKSSRDAFLRGLMTEQKKSSKIGKRLIVYIGDTFYGWFVRILPLLKENAFIVMDNASCHSVKKCQMPTMSWKKQHIIDWLESKGEIVTHPIVKIDLIKKVRKLKKTIRYIRDRRVRKIQ